MVFLEVEIRRHYDLIQKVKKEYNYLTSSVLYQLTIGFALEGNQAEADKFWAMFEDNYPSQVVAELEKMAYEFSERKHMAAVYALLKKVNNEYPNLMVYVLEKIVKGFFAGGHRIEAYKFLEQVEEEHPGDSCRVMLSIAKIEYEANRRIDDSIALKSLALVKDDDHRYVMGESIKRFVDSSSKLVNQANKFNKFMRAESITYNQLQGWIKPEIRLWLLQGVVSLNKEKPGSKLHLRLYQFLLSVVTYLIPVTVKEAHDLSNKIFDKTGKARFFRTLSFNNIPAVADQPSISIKQEAKSTVGREDTSLIQSNLPRVSS